MFQIYKSSGVRKLLLKKIAFIYQSLWGYPTSIIRNVKQRHDSLPLYDSASKLLDL